MIVMSLGCPTALQIISRIFLHALPKHSNFTFMPNRFHNPKFGIFSAILSMLCPNLKFFKEHMKTFLIEQRVHGIRGYWSRYVLLVAMHAFQWPEVIQALSGMP